MTTTSIQCRSLQLTPEGLQAGRFGWHFHTESSQRTHLFDWLVLGVGVFPKRNVVRSVVSDQISPASLSARVLVTRMQQVRVEKHGVTGVKLDVT